MLACVSFIILMKLAILVPSPHQSLPTPRITFWKNAAYKNAVVVASFF